MISNISDYKLTQNSTFNVLEQECTGCVSRCVFVTVQPQPTKKQMIDSICELIINVYVCVRACRCRYMLGLLCMLSLQGLSTMCC